MKEEQLIPDINCSILRGVIINKVDRTIHFLEQFIIYNACMYLFMYFDCV